MSGKHQRSEPRVDRRLRADRYRPRRPERDSRDPYERRAKPADALVCDRCGVVFHGGRWYWGQPPLTDVSSGLCPACERIRDRYPAGTLRLPSDFLDSREEVLALIENVEQAERTEHPLERLMEVRDEPDGGLVVTTTGVHVARAIANALERRFHRESRIRYGEELRTVDVRWDG